MGMEDAVRSDREVVGVEGLAGHVQRRRLVRDLLADNGIGWAFGQGAHAPTSCGVAVSACSLRSAVPRVAVRYAALARWSSIGVPSARITAAASRTTSALHARPSSAASVASARIGVAAT